METRLRNYQKKDYEELELKDDFMFGKVMQNKELCRRTLETLLEMPIKDITRLEKQKEIRMLLEYLDNKTVANELTRELDQAVEEARLNEKWRLEYMKERVIYMEARADGRRDGLEEGLKEGLKMSELNVAKMLVKNVDAAMQNFHVDLTGACQGLGHTIEEYYKAKELIDNREKPEMV